MKNLNDHGLPVKRRFSPDKSFPLGLRISHQAANEIGSAEIVAFHSWCAEHDCYLLTINGFPFGNFHGGPVKASVYEPDWRTQARVDYTKRLADLAVALMTQERPISISTVPIAYKQGFVQDDWAQVRENLIATLEHLRQIKIVWGVEIRLALEPEPCCVLETMAETVDFFARMNFPEEYRPFIGICFDACHQAVEYEQPAQCLADLAQARIPIMKVQVSSALRALEDEIPALLNFAEPVYLHQAIARMDASSEVIRFSDLPEFAQFLADGNKPQECRVHFHVPIFIEHLGSCGTTRFFLQELLPLLDKSIPLEVETYSFGALPAHLRTESLEQSIARELQWADSQLNASNLSNVELHYARANV
jgi:hypothetical protein